jgi:hypothetical protein
VVGTVTGSHCPDPVWLLSAQESVDTPLPLCLYALNLLTVVFVDGEVFCERILLASAQ